MNNHPLDEVFRRKLAGLEAGAPLHLWERIEQKRSWQHRLRNRLRQQPPVVVLLSALLVVGMVRLVLFWQPGELSALDSFPIPQPTVVAEEALPLAGQALESLQGLDASASSAASSTPAKPAAARRSAAAAQSAQQATQNNALLLALPLAAPEALPALSAQSAVPENALLPMEVPPLPTLAASVPDGRPRFLSGLFSPDPKCAHFGTGPWQFYVDALLSPDLAFRNLQSRNPEYEHYLASRNETESYLYAFSGALRLSAVNHSGWAIRSGINYSQITERFDYFSGSEQITKYISRFDQHGNVIGTDTIIEVGARHKVTHNAYRMLDIPFLLGYELGGGKLSISANAGAYLNLLFRQRGDFLSPQDMRPVRFDSSQPDAYPAFRQQVGLGWYGSMGFAFRASSKLQILVEPHFKIFPRPVTLDQFVLEQRYLTTGVFVGLRAQL